MSIDLIALSGPMYSGKTTLSRELQKQGYLFIRFNDMLKHEALIALRSVGISTTLELLLLEKAKYRGFLQELGVLLDFDHNPEWVVKALTDAKWFELGRPKAVFDNVRTVEQFLALKYYGFELVELVLSPNDVARRANGLGVPTQALDTVLRHPIEAGLQRPDLVSMRLDATLDPQTNIQYLLGNLPDLPTLRGIPIVEHTKSA